MFSQLRAFVVVFIILVTTTFAVSPAQAAKRRPNRPQRPAYTQTEASILFAYGFVPYIYYEQYGFDGIQGAPNANPVQFGYGESTFGTSDFPFGSSTFGY
jgi:hypothetical protein